MSELQASGVPGLDLDAFRGWYDGVRPGEVAGELRARVIAGGKSNLTYEVTDGTSWWIVRRPPLGHVLATAHDMGREFTAMSALADTDVPVPRTYAHCTDPEVLGEPFYVMERVVGTPYRSRAQLEELGAERTRAIATEMIDVLARLHAVDPAAVGLDGFGRPLGFLGRQVKRWGMQLDASKTRPLPDADRLLERLAAEVPAGDGEDATIVHGDYRLDNLLVDADHAEPVRAVVDWEMATLGDPLTDVALLMVYDDLGNLHPGNAVADASTAPGYPATEEHLARYAASSGRDLSGIGFRLGLAHLKLAVICEGINLRHQLGQTVGEGFDAMGEAVEPLLAAGLAALDTRP
ncbi:phosphotransferase family protein [Nocardioides sp. SYSU D00038]|uniref:phosphotransferase family protein n=1 Tax=Nocardioides sp. SYSU D00038 TaxID=2812554 RepID=UPI00196894D9|nr:phosphotransferase family protein [Nocardioides sp. SYSU D00038]